MSVQTTSGRLSIKGRVITAADPGYDEARAVFYGGIDRHPAVIARVADANDVSRVIAFTRETGLELAVRSGGHSVVGHCVTEGGVVLDLKDMRALEIDAERRRAWAETGLTAVEYSKATNEHGLGTGFGDTGSVGIGGITLGGGVGYLSRKHGLTIDSLLAADVVTADGQLLRADANTNPDLFWAIRGGGGNFGVATRFLYKLNEVGTCFGGMLLLPATSETVHRFIELSEAAPEELTAIANVMPVPPMPFVPAEHHGKLGIMALMVHAGDPEAGERAIAPFRAIASPMVDMLKRMQYPEIYPPDDPSYHPVAAGRTLFVDSLDRGDTDAIIENLEASNAYIRVAQIRVLGGAVARVPVEATAYAHRNRRIMINVAAVYDRPEEAAKHEAWVDKFARVLKKGRPGAYVNFLTKEGEAAVREAYPGPTLDRLRKLKAKYDPKNLFRLNQNIPPAT